MPISALSKQHLTLTCDTVADVLDIYRDRSASQTSANRPKILDEVKLLFASLQKLETDEAISDGAIHTADPRATGNLSGVLDDCGVIAKRLRMRIERSALTDDADISRELISLSAEIDSFLKTYAKTAIVPTEDDTELTRNEREELEELGARFDQLLLERQDLTTDLRNQEAQIADLLRKNAELNAENGQLKFNGESKLHHIKRLHAAITCLGLRHPTRHKLQTWEELTDELPSMVDKIEDTNEKLKELEDAARLRKGSPVARTRRRRGHSRMQSEPKVKFDVGSSRPRDGLMDLVHRSPSPTDSNISVPRDPPGASKSGSWKRRGKSVDERVWL